MITGEQLTRAAGEDNHRRRGRGWRCWPPKRPSPLEVSATRPTAPGDLRAALAAAGHTAVIKPRPLRPAVEGGFTLDDFTVDEPAGTVTCPAGVTRRITARRNVTFGAACRGCPLRARCTTRPRPGPGPAPARRAAARGPPRLGRSRERLRDTYRQHRPMVERSIAWLIGPKSRCRQLRYRGVAKGGQWLHLRMAALNLRRMINLGLQPAASGGWIIPGPA